MDDNNNFWFESWKQQHTSRVKNPQEKLSKKMLKKKSTKLNVFRPKSKLQPYVPLINHPAAYEFLCACFLYLLTCGRVVAGSVPDWCCRRWRPEWGWCYTRPPPLLSCCLAGHVTEPVTAAASLPWSLTGWRPWHWGLERSRWRRARF